MPNAESFSPFSVVVVVVVFAVEVEVEVEVAVAVAVAVVVELLVFVSPHPVSATHESSKSNVPADSDTAAREEIFSEKLNLDPQEVLKSRLHKT